jgi:4-hydroxybenzoate polyprenyltransferase
VIADLEQFILERFPLKITVPLSAILFAAPFSVASFDIPKVLFGVINVFGFLLLLRMQDDLDDIEVDSILHPERGLVKGYINANKLRAMVAIGAGALLAVNSGGPWFLLVLAMTLVYGVFYSIKPWIPLPLSPLLTNAVFFFIPVYAGVVAEGIPTWTHVLLGLFVWSSVVAHDFAHSVHGLDEAPDSVRTFSTVLGNRGSAFIALGAFVLAGLLGMLFSASNDKPLWFSVFLMLTFLQILWMGIRLARFPTVRNARPFYIFGFVFFLLPLLGLIVDNFLAYK